MTINILIRNYSDLLVFLNSAIINDDACEIIKFDGELKKSFISILDYNSESKEETLVQVKFLLDILSLPKDREGILEQVYYKLVRIYEIKVGTAMGEPSGC